MPIVKTTIAEYAARYCEEFPQAGRIEFRDGLAGVLFLDEGEHIPFTDLGYHDDYGFYRLSALPEVKNQASRYRTDYTRAEIKEIARKSIVHQDKWSNRDTASAQMKVGTLMALLEAGCEMAIDTGGQFPTDQHTIWVTVKVPGFSYFEGGEMDEESFYLPTPERLLLAKGEDWY
ncbi:MAG: hypothetical protein KJ077_35755 [Anaerolineae bacterium]|nr:hypothetical protein [Anaerolineae bacterium]